jgi:hypothetical protein
MGRITVNGRAMVVVSELRGRGASSTDEGGWEGGGGDGPVARQQGPLQRVRLPETEMVREAVSEQEVDLNDEGRRRVVVHGWYVKDLTGRMQKCGPGIPAAWTRVRPPPSSSRWQDGCYCNGDQTKHRPSRGSVSIVRF